MKSSDPPQVILATGFLAGKQFVTVDEVGGQHLVHGVQVPLDYSRLHKTPSQCHVLLCRHSSLSSLPTHIFLHRVDTMTMMPPEGVRRIDQRLIHPSA